MTRITDMRCDLQPESSGWLLKGVACLFVCSLETVIVANSSAKELELFNNFGVFLLFTGQ